MNMIPLDVRLRCRALVQRLRSSCVCLRPILDKYLGPCLDLIEFVVTRFMRYIGPILCTSAVVLISLVPYNYFAFVFPQMLEEDSMVYNCLITGIGLWLLFNVYFNHLACRYVGPGFALKSINEYPRTVSDKFRFDPDLRGNHLLRYCSSCEAHRPWRAHHCGICGGCVLRMDHHCPWVWTCVGWKNYKYFVSFLIYLWIGTIFYCTIAYRKLNDLYVMSHCWMVPILFCSFHGRGNDDIHEIFIFVYFLCMGIMIVMTGFVGFHMFLIATNQTTIEAFGTSRLTRRRIEGLNKVRFVFSLGAFKNFEEVFGPRPWYKWWIPSLQPPPGNGFVYDLSPKVANLVYGNSANVKRAIPISPNPSNDRVEDPLLAHTEKGN